MSQIIAGLPCVATATRWPCAMGKLIEEMPETLGAYVQPEEPSPGERPQAGAGKGGPSGASSSGGEDRPQAGVLAVAAVLVEEEGGTFGQGAVEI